MSRLVVQMEIERHGSRLRVDAACSHFPLVLLGPSGAGKTTLLECLAGLARPHTGSIRWDTRWLLDTTRGIDLPPERRKLGYVMQDDALFPHCSVRDNVLFGVRGHDRQQALRLLEELGIDHLAARKPPSISGGERARVALARALAARPELLLLDEPFAGLDPGTRHSTQQVLRRALAARSLPALLVTHDRGEALAWGEWTWLLLHGEVVQAGTPESILRRPATHAAAAFVGTENFIAGQVIAARDGICRVLCHGQEFHASGSFAPETPVFLCVRPEDLLLAPAPAAPSSARNAVTARVVAVAPRGELRSVELEDHVGRWQALITRQAEEDLDIRPGAVVVASFKATAAHLLERAASRRA